jgi:serine/threonine-protein kinase
LADLYWSRARNADKQRRGATQIYYEALVLEHDVDGHYAGMIRADAALSLRSTPSGAHVVAQRYIEQDRVMVPGEERFLGRTPFENARLEPGAYLITIRSPGHVDARYPVLLGQAPPRERSTSTSRRIGDGFVHVPASSHSAAIPAIGPIRARRFSSRTSRFRFPVTCPVLRIPRRSREVS